MARQARAEITRDAVLAGAAQVFLRLGYANASLNEIMAHSNVTKGALYFHFGSKEELARTVVDLGDRRLRDAMQTYFDQRVPALESCIGISYVVADLAVSDPMVGAMLRLNQQIGDFYGTTGENLLAAWTKRHSALVARALEEGDVRCDVDPESLSLTLQEMILGVHLVAVGLDQLDRMASRLERYWFYLLPSIVPEDKAGYFRQFAARRLRSDDH